MGSILDKYKAQLEIDEMNDNKMSFPEHHSLNEDDREAYEETLNKLKNDPNDIANHAKEMNKQMVTKNEMELFESGCLKEENVSKIFVNHAYCEECGEELISDAPPMFNPFTLERVCIHKCKKCGKTYNLEYAYPRFVLVNENGEEIKAYSR